jgi:hypothetical protein
MRDGYGNCEMHNKFLHLLAKGKVSKDEVQSVDINIPFRSGNGFLILTYTDFDVQYDVRGQYVRSSFGSSTTE